MKPLKSKRKGRDRDEQRKSREREDNISRATWMMREGKKKRDEQRDTEREEGRHGKTSRGKRDDRPPRSTKSVNNTKADCGRG